MIHFEIFKDRAGEWRWRLRAANGQILATSSEGYEKLDDCHYAIILVQCTDIKTPIEDLG